MSELGEEHIRACDDTCLVRACVASQYEGIPAMPVVDSVSSVRAHRDKNAPRLLPFNALVARSVGKAEIRRSPEAQAALKKEWDKLVDQKVWDASSVCEWRDAAARARKDGIEAQFGHIFAICVEKNSELPKGVPRQSCC